MRLMYPMVVIVNGPLKAIKAAEAVAVAITTEATMVRWLTLTLLHSFLSDEILHMI
jgi:hypothetical protein